MRSLLFIASMAFSLSGGDPPRASPAPPALDIEMARLDGAACVYVEGRWDEKGRPVITDRMLYNKYDPSLKLTYGVRNRLRVTYQSGEVKEWPADTLTFSDGVTQSWKAFYRTGEENRYSRFRNFGGSPIVKYEWKPGGGPSVEGLQDCLGPKPPRLRIWDTPGVELRWELTNGCGFDPDVTHNDGLNWHQVPRTPQGTHVYKDLATQGPVVYRFVAYQGLNAYAFVYRAGIGFEPSPTRYIMDSVHHVVHPKGWRQGIDANTFPEISFIGSQDWNWAEYQVTLRRIMHPELLPFDAAKLCPSKFVQAIVAVSLDRDPGVDPNLKGKPDGNYVNIRLDDRLLANPKEIDHLNVYWVVQKDGKYISKKLLEEGLPKGSLGPRRRWETDKEWYHRNEVYGWGSDFDPAQVNYYVMVAEHPPTKGK